MAEITHVGIPVENGRMRAALSLPDDDLQPAPAVLIPHALFGLNDDIRDIAARFADHGYVAVAPDLYSAHPPLLPKPICILRTMRSLLPGGGRVYGDLMQAHEWLAARDDVDPSRLAVAGFCLGGGFAILHAVRAPIGAAAAFYGRVPRDRDALDGICPTFAGYGANDRAFARQPQYLRDHLTELDVPHEIVVYPDAGHSYMNRQRRIIGWLSRSSRAAAYHEASAEDSWTKMLAFFDQHLNGPVADQPPAD